MDPGQLRVHAGLEGVILLVLLVNRHVLEHSPGLAVGVKLWQRVC